MPFVQPGLGEVHVNRPLTNIAIAYMQMADNFVADRVFPPVPVPNKTDSYYTIPRGAWYRDEFQERAPGAESAGATYTIDTASYDCKVYAAHHDVSDQVRANQDTALNVDRQAVEFLMQKGLIRKERQWATDHLATSLWTFNVDGAATRSASFNPAGTTANDVIYWNRANSTPIEDIRLLKQYVAESTGYMPNVLVLGLPVYNVLVDHDDIIGRLNAGQTPGGPAMAMRGELARLFEVDEVLVMSGVHNSGDEGETDDFDFISGKNGLLAYRAPSPGLMVPSAGYTFNWTGYAASVMGGVEISRFRMDHLRSDRIEGEMAFDQKLVSADLGVFFDDIVE